MASTLLAIQLVLGLIPSIMATIQAIETPGNGPDKAATVVQIVLAGLESVSPDLAAKVGLDKVQVFIAKAIDILVGFLNKVGVFKK